MAAINKKHLNDTVGNLYVAPITTASTLVTPLGDGSNAKAVFDAFETTYASGVWKRIASITDLEISEDFAAEKQETETDDTGLIYSSSTRKASIKATWYESKSPEVLAILTGIPAVKHPNSGSATDNYTAYNLESAELPRFAVKIEGLRKGQKAETYYISDATIGGQIITQFLKKKGGLEGSSVEIMASDGGFITKKLPI